MGACTSKQTMDYAKAIAQSEEFQSVVSRLYQQLIGSGLEGSDASSVQVKKVQKEFEKSKYLADIIESSSLPLP